MTYDYLVTGEMTHIRENGAGSGLGVLATYAYDDLGRRTTLTRGNGTVSTWSYDNISRLSSLALDLASTASDVTNSYSYSPAGQITSFTRSNDSYAWTGAANVNRSYTTNGLNQHTLSGAVSLGYDARGNLTSSGSDSYGYSSENLLTSGPGVTLAYDPLLRLASITTSTFTTRWQYDGADLIAEYDSSGTLGQRFVHGPGTDEPLNQYVASGSVRYWLHADERGSIVRATNDSGASIATGRYDEYGIPQFSTGPRFAYTGQTWIAELGMYNYKARMYSPTLGRFMQADPIGYSDGMNIYAYVGGDPVNSADPSGLARINVWKCLQHYTETFDPTTGETKREDGPIDNCKLEYSYDEEWNILDTYTSGELGSGGGAGFDGIVVTAPQQRNRPARSGLRIGPHIRVHEGGVHDGHTIRVHVGRSIQQLRARFRDQRKTEVSSFYNVGLANSAFREAMRQNKSSIMGWLGYQNGAGWKIIQYRSPEPLGIVLGRHDKNARVSYDAIFVIAPSQPGSPYDIALITGYLK